MNKSKSITAQEIIQAVKEDDENLMDDSVIAQKMIQSIKEEQEKCAADPIYNKKRELSRKILGMNSFKTHSASFIERYRRDHLYAIDNDIDIVLGENREEKYGTREKSRFNHGECWVEKDDYENYFYIINGDEVSYNNFMFFRKITSKLNGRNLLKVLEDLYSDELPTEARWIFQDPYDSGIGTSIDPPHLSGGEIWNQEYRMSSSVKTLKIPGEIAIDWGTPIKITTEIRQFFQIKKRFTK